MYLVLHSQAQCLTPSVPACFFISQKSVTKVRLHWSVYSAQNGDFRAPQEVEAYPLTLQRRHLITSKLFELQTV